jgi:hypothetical protein
LTGCARFDGDEGVRIKEKNSAVGVIGFSRRSFRLENRIGGARIFLAIRTTVLPAPVSAEADESV